MLATYRTAEAALDPDVSDVIAALESASPPMVLAGLSTEEIGLMLPGAGAGVLAAVQRRGEGNPLFVSQVARLLGSGAAEVEDVPVPAGIRQAVRRQVARLGRATDGDSAPAPEEILATAAALGPGIDPVLVAAALAAPAAARYRRTGRTGRARGGNPGSGRRHRRHRPRHRAGRPAPCPVGHPGSRGRARVRRL